MKNIFLILALATIIFNISCKKDPIASTNTAPTASFTVNSTTGTTATTFTFDASGSTDNEDATTELQVRWDWNNDGTYDTDFSTTKTANHQYADVGTYTVKLEVKDGGDLTHTTTKQIIVSTVNTAPTASFTVNPTIGTPATIFAFDASGSTDNEDAATTSEVRWDWNDDGTYDTNYSTTKTETHQYNTIGNHTIMLEVKDSGGLTNTTTKSIEVQQASTIVTFQDANFESLIREVIIKPNGDITDADMLTITNLDGIGRNISNISGIEYCLNLKELDLSDNQIIDISALSGLTNLKKLTLIDNNIIDISALSGLTNIVWLLLVHNQIVDIGSLSGLTNLEELFLNENQIIDISALSGLTNLEWLDLDKNQIIDISALSGLTNLKRLTLIYNQIIDIGALSGLTNLENIDLDFNQINDISALSGLTNLKIVYLYNNWISDIVALIQNSGIDNGDYVFLSNNPLSDTSINTYIPQLQARGVNVSY